MIPDTVPDMAPDTGIAPGMAPEVVPAGSLNILHVLRAPVGGLFRHVVDLARGQAACGHRIGLVADASTGGYRPRPASRCWPLASRSGSVGSP
jgi:hypothetical protein